ncbi:hypothetical protein B0T10DRAFT_502388 [Thelonectria olida]|uniref:Uncharacterized protein n=1 Tax=Thelonectria olida TaxID=1576542 RepID=A0A9P8VML1_9HYPO|nr:hypothetical protein B0T10DRAFT_502388 [Thelonectria olida]
MFSSTHRITDLLAESAPNRFVSAVRLWMGLGRASADRSTFLPFGRASVSREVLASGFYVLSDPSGLKHHPSEMASIFSLANITSCFRNESEFGLPKPLQRSLVLQFQKLITDPHVPLENIPVGLRLIALEAMTKQELGIIQAERPELLEWERDINKSAIKIIGEETDFLRAFSNPLRMIATAFQSHGHATPIQSTPRSSRALEYSMSAWKLSEAHMAAYRGDYASLAGAIDKGEAGICENEVLWTPLHSAVLNGDKRAADMLLKGGADINAHLGQSSPCALAPLLLAIVLDHVPIVKLLLQYERIDIWVREYGYWSSTAAHLAAEFCSRDSVLKMLLSRDSLLARSRDARRRTPLHRATGANNIDCVKTLIKFGADIDATDVSLITPLHKAYAAGNGFQGVIEMMSLDTKQGAEGFGPQFTVVDSSAPEVQEGLRNAGFGSLYPELLEAFLPLSTLMMEKFEYLVSKCPSDHDPFILVNECQILRHFGSNSGVETLFLWLNSQRRLLPQEDFERRFRALHFPPSSFSSSIVEFEINLRTLSQNFSPGRAVPLDAKLPGQKGVTYISNNQSQEIISYLLRKGASPEAEKTTSYTPECYSYRPSDLLWCKNLLRESSPDFEPEKACNKASMRYTESNTGEVMDLPSLHVKAFKGSFSIWRWIPTVLPGLRLICVGGRAVTDEQAIQVSDYNVTIEVRMFPPNVSEQVLVKLSLNDRESLGREDQDPTPLVSKSRDKQDLPESRTRVHYDVGRVPSEAQVQTPCQHAF